MKAAIIERHGGPEELQYADLPDPKAAPGHVVVTVHAASVNAADWKVRQGSEEQKTFPYVLGRDFSGVISEIGAGVDDLVVGDEVFGVCETHIEGAYAEKVAIAANIVAKKRPELSHVETAAVALIGLTASISLEETLQLKAGETVLIQGGAGGVAGFAIQLAKHLGATVITTASPSNHDYVQSLGADEIIDYNTQDFVQIAPDCDAVFETVGGDVATRSFEVLRAGGRAAFIASGATAPPSPRDDVASLRPAVKRDRPHLDRVLDLVISGAIALPEITTYPLSEAAAAHRISEARHLRGKLVFAVSA